MPRILILNGNTSASVTDLVTGHVRAELGAQFALTPITARFGACYISTEAAAAIAAHAALDCVAEHGAGCDAVLLACFGDPGLFALREVSAAPVVGLAQAAMHEAAVHGRFAIVTGGVLWKPMLERLAFSLGCLESIASIRTIRLTGDLIAADPDGALRFLGAEVRHAVEQDGAQAVILGGAALAGLAARLAHEVPVPLIDSVLAGARVVAARAMEHTTRMDESDDVTGASGARASTPTVGLSPALARLLG